MKILYVTTISLTMNSFFKPHIKMLVAQGHHVDMACNYQDLALDNLYQSLGCHFFQIDFSRSPLSKNNIKAYRQLKKVIENGNYDIVHCHTPNAAVITRLVCRKIRKKTGLQVFYTAHGFHFYKGAPLKNWLLYYPVEKFCSNLTDVLITINQEDYALAQKKMRAKRVAYIPGVGIDLSRFENISVDRVAKRREIGVPDDAFLLISVGELNENKNHQVIIKALAKLNNPNIHYAIAGVGDKRTALIELARQLGIENQVHLLGYRRDVPELNCSADVFCFPSIREGLPVSLIEAAACGLPLIAAYNRGTRDIIENSENGILCGYDSVEDFAVAISQIFENVELRDAVGERVQKSVQKFSLDIVLEQMKKIYEDLP